MKQYWVGTSWKMNKTLAEALDFCEIFQSHKDNIPAFIQPFVIPPFTAVREVTHQLNQQKTRCLTGVQNMHFAEEGAFTGEISPRMVTETGATLIEIGHSERRTYFGETDITVNKKVHASLNHQLRPLVCVGDELSEKQWGASAETVIRQMKAALYQVAEQDVPKVILAYEPVWAIGEGGIPATAEEAAYVHDAMRQALITMYGSEIAEKVTLLYGGSVNLNNAVELISQQNIDGLFVGRSAWNANGFCALLDKVAQFLSQKP